MGKKENLESKRNYCFIVMPSFRNRERKKKLTSTTTTTTTTTTTVESTTQVVPTTTTTTVPTTTVELTTFEIPTTTVEFREFLSEELELTTVFVPVFETTETTTTTSATTTSEATTSVASTAAAVTTLLTTTLAPLLSTMSNDTVLIEEDPVKAIQMEVLLKLNKAVEEWNRKMERKEEEPLFGMVEKKVQETTEEVVEAVERASFGEVLALVIATIIMLYYLDKILKFCFRYSVKKNFQYLENGIDGDDWRNKTKMWMWWILEEVLEKIWIPLWFQGKDIRRRTLVECVEGDLESLQALIRPPNNTMASPGNASRNITKAQLDAVSEIQEAIKTPIFRPRPRRKEDLDEERKR